LDVLSIEQQLLQAQRQLADLNAEQITLSIQLMQALGGGFEPGNAAAAVPVQVSLAE
ncbi:MAG: multidrug RND transporter, partial [Pseudomonas sp.]|nr:multidrug RND transporter [Pseudomonas sp.]